MRSLVFLIALVAAPAVAQTGLTPMAGYDFSHQSPTVGLALEIDLPRGALPFAPSVRPSAEYVFRDQASVVLYYDAEVFRADVEVLGRFRASGAPFAP